MRGAARVDVAPNEGEFGGREEPSAHLPHKERHRLARACRVRLVRGEGRGVSD